MCDSVDGGDLGTAPTSCAAVQVWSADEDPNK